MLIKSVPNFCPYQSMENARQLKGLHITDTPAVSMLVVQKKSPADSGWFRLLICFLSFSQS